MVDMRCVHLACSKQTLLRPGSVPVTVRQQLRWGADRRPLDLRHRGPVRGVPSDESRSSALLCHPSSAVSLRSSLWTAGCL